MIRKTILCAALLVSSFAAAQTDVKTVAKNVDRHYNTLHSLRAEFTESYRGAGINRSESGTLVLLRPGRMRWDYREPKEKVFIVDGKTAWFYVPSERQVRKVGVKTLDDLRTPLAYLLGRTKLERVFEGLSLAPDAKTARTGNTMLRGFPKNMRDRVNQVLLEITPQYSIERIVVEEADGSTTEFRLMNQQRNPVIAVSAFRFQPPRGVEVIDAKELTGR